jgi:hypothetical protein
MLTGKPHVWIRVKAHKRTGIILDVYKAHKRTGIILDVYSFRFGQ